MKGSLDLVMIVRDEARCIGRCLESARPWVDRMLVLDTGSRDDTVAIATRARRAGTSFHLGRRLRCGPQCGARCE